MALNMLELVVDSLVAPRTSAGLASAMAVAQSIVDRASRRPQQLREIILPCPLLSHSSPSQAKACAHFQSRASRNGHTLEPCVTHGIT
jgi:hypothetical protein